MLNQKVLMRDVRLRTCKRRIGIPKSRISPSVICQAGQSAQQQAEWVLRVASSMAMAQQQPHPLKGLLETFSGNLNAEFLSEDYQIDHCGVLLHSESSEDLLTTLSEQGFEILQRFPSKILAEKIRKTYKKPVSIDVVKLERGGVKLELFLVISGLDPEETVAASRESNHGALVPRKGLEEVEFKTFFEFMANSGLSLKDKGINKQEMTSNARGELVKGMTVMYFDCGESLCLGVGNKIELCVPGIHPDLISQAEASLEMDLAP